MNLGDNRRAWLVPAAALLVWASWPHAAFAENRFLAKARQANDQAQYDKVLPLLDKALASNPSADEEIEIFALQAAVHVTFGRTHEAKSAFLRLLARRPDYTLPEYTSPKIRSAFAAARTEFDRNAATTNESDKSVAPGKDLDKSPATSPRADEESAGTAAAAPSLSLAPIDNELTQPRDSLSPSFTGSLGAMPGAYKPFYRKTWFWLAISVAVLGGGGGAYWAVTHQPVPEHDFGPYPLK